jgi:16S rRNA (guanine1207-N2)-methyltransferase
MPESQTPLAEFPPARPAEQMLLDMLPELRGPRILCTTAGRGQLAVALADQDPASQVVCPLLEHHLWKDCTQLAGKSRKNLRFVCTSDLPEGEFDVVAMPTHSKGEAELTQELLQQAFERVAPGGLMVVSTDNEKDQWLREQLREYAKPVTRRDVPDGIVYLLRKSALLKKRKKFEAEVVFRDGEHLLRTITRPGVFAHRKIDPGCRQLLNAMVITPGMRVLDLGCGSGAISLAAAAREPSAVVHAVDGNARAVQCVERSAALNKLTNITTELTSAFELGKRPPFDIAVVNPPYFGQFDIAARMLEMASEALKPGGEVLVVHKHPDWYEEHFPKWFTRVEHLVSKDYRLARGRRR